MTVFEITHWYVRIYLKNKSATSKTQILIKTRYTVTLEVIFKIFLRNKKTYFSRVIRTLAQNTPQYSLYVQLLQLTTVHVNFVILINTD